MSKLTEDDKLDKIFTDIGEMQGRITAAFFSWLLFLLGVITASLVLL